MQAPAKLVIRGVPADSPLYNAVARQFGGHLKQFHSKQQQAYALSNDQIHSGHVDWGDARATYTNIQGQEIIELEVDIPLLEQLEKSVSVPPDYAVVDFVVTGEPSDSDFFFSAALITPDVGREVATIETYTVTKGIEFDDGLDPDYSSGIDAGVWPPPPIIEFANAFDADGSISDITNRISSLKIDFTTLDDHAMVVVDIYAHTDPEVEIIDDPPVFLGWTTTGTGTQANGFDHSDPGDLLIDGEFNPACLTYSEQLATISAVIAGSPDPNTIVFRGDFGGEILGSGGVNEAYTEASAALNSEHSQTTTQTHSPDEPYVDYWNGNLFYDWTHQALSTIVDGTNFTPPEPYLSEGYDFAEYDMYKIYENTLYYNKLPVYDYPTHDVEVPVSRDCDIVYGFYERGSRLLSDYIVDYPNTACAIWVMAEGEPPTERVKFGEVTISSDSSSGEVTVDNPKGWGYLGRLVVDRATRSIGWTPV
jgi:hypothetical protein